MQDSAKQKTMKIINEQCRLAQVRFQVRWALVVLSQIQVGLQTKQRAQCKTHRLILKKNVILTLQKEQEKLASMQDECFSKLLEIS